MTGYDPVSGDTSSILLVQKDLEGPNQPVEPVALALDEGGRPGRLWVVDGNGLSVFWIDPSNPAVAPGKSSVLSTPTEVTVADGVVWVTSTATDDVYELDARTGSVSPDHRRWSA